MKLRLYDILYRPFSEKVEEIFLPNGDSRYLEMAALNIFFINGLSVKYVYIKDHHSLCAVANKYLLYNTMTSFSQ